MWIPGEDNWREDFVVGRYFEQWEFFGVQRCHRWIRGIMGEPVHDDQSYVRDWSG